MREWVDIGPLHGYDVKAVSLATSSPGGGVDIVQQQFRDEVDVNTIVKRFGLTGQFPVSSLEGVYGDFTGITDYESAVSAIEAAERSFMQVPPDVRERFGNDPGRLLAFVGQARKQQVVDELGLDVEDRRKPSQSRRASDKEAAQGAASPRPEAASDKRSASVSPKGDV